MVGDVAGNYYYRDGSAYMDPFLSRMITIRREDLVRIPVRIGIAGGPGKVEAIRAALISRLVNSLVTDSVTARQVLEGKQYLIQLLRDKWQKHRKRNYFKQKVERLKLSSDQLLEMYRTMCVIRQFELMADKLYALGKVHGTMHLSAGQEAVAVGLGRAVRLDDYLINHHRGHGHFITKKADINLMMAEFLGKETGYCKGRGGSMHIADFSSHNLGANGIVGGGIPHSLGVGLGLQMQKSDQICISIFGDGASNEGVFHETLNMAALWKLPVLYICENNKYGMSMDIERVSAKLTHRTARGSLWNPLVLHRWQRLADRL